MFKRLDNFNRRKTRNRNKIKSNNRSNSPRIVVFKSNKNFYAQLIDDNNGSVLAAYSSLSAKDQIKKEHKGVEIAAIVGKSFADICKKNKIETVVFDKGAYLYNGRVKAFANSCRDNGLKF